MGVVVKFEAVLAISLLSIFGSNSFFLTENSTDTYMSKDEREMLKWVFHQFLKLGFPYYFKLLSWCSYSTTNQTLLYISCWCNCYDVKLFEFFDVENLLFDCWAQTSYFFRREAMDMFYHGYFAYMVSLHNFSVLITSCF